jgi:hypothetical protein
MDPRERTKRPGQQTLRWGALLEIVVGGCCAHLTSPADVGSDSEETERRSDDCMTLSISISFLPHPRQVSCRPRTAAPEGRKCLQAMSGRMPLVRQAGESSRGIRDGLRELRRPVAA